MLNRESILTTLDLRPTPLEVPEWGGTIYLRAMSLRDMLKLRPLIQSDQDITANLVVGSACDESGELLFKPEDLDAVAAKSNAALQRIALAVLKLNKLGSAEADALAKN